MKLVRIRQKYQITLPAVLMKQFGIAVGDFIEIDEKNGAIVLTPKTLVNRKVSRAA